MKKIINGKIYNSDTAQEVGGWSNSDDPRDLGYIQETLYRKKTGEYFILGEGGPSTQYAVSTGTNSWSGGSRIMPLEWDEARTWAEKHLSADAYESAFGEINEDDSKTVVSLSLSAACIEKAKRAASQAGISLSAYIESLIVG